MKFQKFEISFLIFGSILVVVFNVILVALKVLVVFEIFKETSNKFAVKFLSSRTVSMISPNAFKHKYKIHVCQTLSSTREQLSQLLYTVRLRITQTTQILRQCECNSGPYFTSLWALCLSQRKILKVEWDLSFLNVRLYKNH